jgi:hypothetical protein
MRTAKPIARGTLGTANATLYTVPLSTTTTVVSMVVANKTSADVNATITFAGINIVPNKAIPANDAIIIPLKDAPAILNAGELIEGLASAGTAIDYYITGVEEA